MVKAARPHVLVCRMVDGAVAGELAPQPVINQRFIRHQIRFAARLRDDRLTQRLGGYVRNVLGPSAPATLNQREHGSFTWRRAKRLIALLCRRYKLNWPRCILTHAQLQLGQIAKGTFHFSDGHFLVGLLVDTADPSGPYMELIHPTRDEGEDDRIVHDRVRLLWTVPTYGGRRWWFQCPRTGRKATKLFLPNGGRHFWSRQAYGLGYACQREDRFDRLHRRAAMLNRQLGGKGWGSWNIPPASRNGCAGEPTRGNTKRGVG
jgi:hypothetical protein